MHLSVDAYDAALLLVGLGVFGMVVLPRFLASRSISYPILYVAAGALLAVLPLPVEVPEVDPAAHVEVVERLAELTVIISLTGVGLKLERPFALRGWRETWRLLAFAMPLTILGVALLGLWAGLPLAAALLAGAALAPTDPVLASDVQVAGPNEVEGAVEEGDDELDPAEQEDRVRFALTSEAGLNDGLAFPFTYLAIGVAATGAVTGGDLLAWAAVAVLLRIAVGVAVGWAAGRLVGWIVFTRRVGEHELARTAEGLIALAVTLLSFAAAELAQGYGFIAVFVAALALREYERGHEFHTVLHQFADQAERLMVALVLVLLGAAVGDGLLRALTPGLAAVAVALVLVVRPLSGALSFVGSGIDRREVAIVSFFGIRGVGSIYYVAYAFAAEPTFPAQDALWAFIAFAILVSIVVHGTAATPTMQRFDRLRAAR